MIRFIGNNIAQILSQNYLPFNDATSEYIDKPCILLTEGTFQSMDGEVTITPEHLHKIVETYNSKIDAIKATGRELVMADYHPAQLDHSTSAKDTIGRLIGPMYVEERDGKQTLHGVIRFLGAENVERVQDGRYTHLSVGINNLETCELDEITVTPFPACKNAILLSNKGASMNEEEKKKAEEEAKKLAEEKEAEEKEKEKKLAAEKAKEDDEIKAKKKLEDDEKEENKTKLSSILTGIKTKQEGIRLAIKQSNIKARLSKLRAEAKLTPAEQKKIDVVRLSKMNEETITEVLATFENRQPVIHTPIYGSVNAVNPAKVANDIRMSELEKETRARFNSIPKKLGDEKSNDNDAPVNKTPETNDETSQTDLWDEIVKSIKTGDENAAKEMYRRMVGTKLNDEGCATDETEMKKLMSDFASLETDYSEGIRLATVISGIKI